MQRITAAAVQRTTIRGHTVRRVDGVNGLYVYAVAYGGGSDGAKHDALATQLWPSARIAAGLVADAAPASSMVEIGCGLALPSLAAARAGVKEGDVIRRVNGRLVTGDTHTDVVHLIQGECMSSLGDGQ